MRATFIAGRPSLIFTILETSDFFRDLVRTFPILTEFYQGSGSILMSHEKIYSYFTSLNQSSQTEEFLL
ncbi:MAG: hypothetical protein DSZ24_04320 [Thermodesulfatator sp.]|nr:MAG: hypothetical protein DSZ24_04320 [Thermodesulfatator sp.]